MLHNLAESCDHMLPLLQGGNWRPDGGGEKGDALPNFHLLPGVRLEALRVGVTEVKLAPISITNFLKLLG